ncbi:MAG: hypothetical protein ACRCXZ_09785 [Patescibacteria group bacterium]
MDNLDRTPIIFKPEELNFCPEIQNALLNRPPLSYSELAILNSLVLERNREKLEIQLQVTMQIQCGHIEYAKQYSEIMNAMNDKVCTDKIRQILYIPTKSKREKKTKGLSLTKIFLFSFFATGSIFFTYLLYNEYQNNPEFELPKIEFKLFE